MSNQVYSSSEDEDVSVSAQQQVYTPVPEAQPEVIIFGESAKLKREQLQRAGMIRKLPVTINVYNFPGGRVPHGYWKSDIEKRQQQQKKQQKEKTTGGKKGKK
uniref:DUF4174 domain-containing protein n=1 Tax=Steinernema glaseri TaxID=37863 RepID=A0A1I8AFG3_9BILA